MKWLNKLFKEKPKPVYEMYLVHRKRFIEETGYPPTRVNITFDSYQKLLKEMRYTRKFRDGVILYGNKREALEDVLGVRVYIKGRYSNEPK